MQMSQATDPTRPSPTADLLNEYTDHLRAVESVNQWRALLGIPFFLSTITGRDVGKGLASLLLIAGAFFLLANSQHFVELEKLKQIAKAHGIEL